MTDTSRTSPAAVTHNAARPRDRSAAIALAIVAVVVTAGIAFGVGMWRLHAHSIKRSDDASVAAPLATAGSDPQPRAAIVVVARFKDDDVSAIRIGQAAQVRLAGAPGQVWSGRVQAVGAEDDQNAGSAGNFVRVVPRRAVRTAVAATPLQRAQFPPGVAARVDIDTRSGR
ncbi:multidrug resistance efflux pump [Xanthomonas translucens]